MSKAARMSSTDEMKFRFVKMIFIKPLRFVKTHEGQGQELKENPWLLHQCDYKILTDSFFRYCSKDQKYLYDAFLNIEILENSEKKNLF